MLNIPHFQLLTILNSKSTSLMFLQENDVNFWSLEINPSTKEGEKLAKVNLLDTTVIRGSVTGISVSVMT